MVYVCACLCAHTCSCGRWSNLREVAQILSTISETELLCLMACPGGEASWPFRSPNIHVFLPAHPWDCKHRILRPAILHGGWRLNVGAHTYSYSKMSPTELSL